MDVFRLPCVLWQYYKAPQPCSLAADEGVFFPGALSAPEFFPGKHFVLHHCPGCLPFRLWGRPYGHKKPRTNVRGLKTPANPPSPSAGGGTIQKGPMVPLLFAPKYGQAGENAILTACPSCIFSRTDLIVTVILFLDKKV